MLAITIFSIILCLQVNVLAYSGFHRLWINPKINRFSCARSMKQSSSMSQIDEQRKRNEEKGLLRDLVNTLIDKFGEELMDEMDLNLTSLTLDGSSSKADGKLSDNHGDILNAVVRVYCTHTEPNFCMPWQRMKQEFSTSTGFIIDDKRILTNAHAVEYGSLIQVKKRQSEDKFIARVVAVGHECDLALLTVDDESFWNDELKALEFGELPDLQEEVSVVGFPVGGDSISISSGVVSRIEMQEYAQASAQLLAIQIDAAINPGNSGGPVLDTSGTVIGVAFQSLTEDDVENIGYVVPVNVIRHFLDDVKRHGGYSGVCGLGAKFQGLESAQLRRLYGMNSSNRAARKEPAYGVTMDTVGSAEPLTGVLVRSIAPRSPAAAVLEKNDVILSVDGIRVANDGTIPLREGSFRERVQLNYYFTQRFASEKVKLEILRKGNIQEVWVQLWVPVKLIPRTLLQAAAQTAEATIVNGDLNGVFQPSAPLTGGVPSYLMIGGLVLIALSREYIKQEEGLSLKEMGDYSIECWSQELRLLSMVEKYCDEPKQEIVLLSQVLSHSCNVGYENFQNMVLKEFNGIPIKNLKQLKDLVDSCLAKTPKNRQNQGQNMGLQDDLEKVEDNWEPMVFEFANGVVAVLDTELAEKAQKELFEEHLIPSYCSSDLLD